MDRKPYVEPRMARAMNRAILLVPLLLVLLPGCSGDDADPQAPVATDFTITSGSFNDGSAMPQRHTCDGDEVSPQLTITGAPEGTGSLALLMKDEDVPQPTSGHLTHWVVWNVTVGGAVFPEGSAPLGASEGRNDVGRDGYLGPCPPPAAPAHHYNLTVYALAGRPAVRGNATALELEDAMEGHILARTSLHGTYARHVVPTSTPSLP
ncbi:MAG TPA: YbhB/YbcL family Raf kinase inhibitor-like protein [Candidatus Thermoplasmatota archaeon]|nr:YbhB/YbcL family Raf kinase inhibitor-like protein [Candidatus Thermoplasmatota archaeon]